MSAVALAAVAVVAAVVVLEGGPLAEHLDASARIAGDERSVVAADVRLAVAREAVGGEELLERAAVEPDAVAAVARDGVLALARNGRPPRPPHTLAALVGHLV